MSRLSRSRFSLAVALVLVLGGLPTAASAAVTLDRDGEEASGSVARAFASAMTVITDWLGLTPFAGGAGPNNDPTGARLVDEIEEPVSDPQLPSRPLDPEVAPTFD